VTSKT